MKLEAKKVLLAAGLVLALAPGGVPAMSLSNDANIVELLEQSSDILVGTVASVTDGIGERGIPYTEVTLQVSEAIRGDRSGTYKFRQFGLMAPRVTADGTKKMMPAPEGFPKYVTGEEVVLLLRPAAAWSGFRMPAGVSAGKFNLGPGRLANDAENRGLFRNVRLERGLATDGEKRMLAAEGPANPETFLTFLRKAVRAHWVETGRMSRTDLKAAKPGSVR